MQAACDNKNIGYDQGQRGTLYTAAEKVGFDCSKVSVKCETDCSALVRVCLAYAGIKVSNFNTTTEAKTLLASDAIVEMTGDKYQKSSDYLTRGDILVTKTQGHTVVVLSDGAKAEETEENALALGDRDLRKGCKGDDVANLQYSLIALGIDLPKYGVDGDFGSETERGVKEFESIFELDEDGVFSGADAKVLLTALGNKDEPPKETWALIIVGEHDELLAIQKGYGGRLEKTLG